MSQHIAYMKKSVAMTLPALKREYIDAMVKRRTAVVRNRHSIAGHVTPTASRRGSDVNIITTFISDIREEDCIIRGERRKFRRVFVHCPDSGEYAKVGWVLLDDMDFCMTCFKGIQGMFNYKNHCRACGNVICTACSQSQDFVFEIEAVGPAIVCVFCDFGQDPIHAFPNNQQGVTIIDSFDEDLEKDEAELLQSIAQRDSLDEQHLNLWTFGKMTIEPIKGSFVFRTRRDKDFSVLHVNVCSCDAVPINAQHSLEGEIIVYMAISQLYKATNDTDVYDVAVHPKIIMDIIQDKSNAFRGKLCEQILSAISLFTSEASFSTYSLDAKVSGPYLEHKTDPATSAQHRLPNLPYGFHSHIAIPAKEGFLILYQMQTSLQEASKPQAISLGKSPKERDDLLRNLTSLRRDKIRAKLTGRSLSQISTMDSANTPIQPSKTPAMPINQTPVPAAPKFNSLADLFNRQDDAPEEASHTQAIPSQSPTPVPAAATKPAVTPKSSSSAAKGLVKAHKAVSLIPNPGFVVKTKTTSGVDLHFRHSDASDTDDAVRRKSDADHSKVFFNICHHPKVDELMQKYGARRQSLTGNAPKLFMVYGEKGSITDKHGSTATIIVVVVGSSYFAHSDEATAENPLLITSDEYISMIIDHINIHYRENFDSINFSLPRVKGGFKGEVPTEAQTFSYDAMVEAKEEVSLARNSILSDIIHFPKTFADSITGKNRNKSINPKRQDTDDIDDSIHLRTSLGMADDTMVDDMSVMSDVTTESMAGSKPQDRRKTLRSSIFEKMGKLTHTDGQNMVTPAMMLVLDDAGISITDTQNLKHYSCERPDVLLGWQIMLHSSHKKKDIYVVTGMRKNNLSKTEFRLSCLDKVDFWSTLKRAPNKSGVPFQPMRKVLDISEQGVLN